MRREKRMRREKKGGGGEKVEREDWGREGREERRKGRGEKREEGRKNKKERKEERRRGKKREQVDILLSFLMPPLTLFQTPPVTIVPGVISWDTWLTSPSTKPWRKTPPFGRDFPSTSWVFLEVPQSAQQQREESC